MSVLVYIEVSEGSIKKTTLEAVSYATKLAQQTGGDVKAVSIGDIDNAELEKLGAYGCTNVYKVAGGDFNTPSIQAYATAIADAYQNAGATCLVLAKSSLSDAMAGRLAIKLSASLAQNVVAQPNADFTVKTSIYTGKAFAEVSLKNEHKIISLKKGASEIVETGGTASVSDLSPALAAVDTAVAQTGVNKATGDILLPDAEIVVSAGRGLKGPENWGMIEDLAKKLGAATACSKPVSDMDWRPHHEHVGQTGIKVSPNLYIAIGISGAIQHLAGVNSSKTIVVINTDAEAPFFKSADYGIVGDAFEVVPKLLEALN